jgi:preprotein translocase subunit SecE
MIGKLKLFFQESQQEFKRINWPTMRETRNLTLVVILFSLVIAAFLGALDSLFAFLLKEIVQ